MILNGFKMISSVHVPENHINSFLKKFQFVLTMSLFRNNFVTSNEFYKFLYESATIESFLKL